MGIKDIDQLMPDAQPIEDPAELEPESEPVPDTNTDSDD